MARKRATADEPANEDTSQEIPSNDATPDGERRYPPEPNPRGWAHNNAAGIEFRSRREPYQAEIAFREKPSPEVIAVLREDGFRWDGQEKVWTRLIGYNTQAQDRLVASRTYGKVVNLILQAQGLSSEPEHTPF